MKKSKKKVSGRYNVPMPSAMPKQGTPVFAVASIVFGAMFLFALGISTYGNLTGQAIFSTSSSSGGTSDISALNATCYDSDGSLTWPDQYFIRGYCIDSTTNVSEWDFCNSTSSCFEYYCNYQRKCAGINMNCANLNESTGQCSNGACVRKSAFTGSSSGSSGGSSTVAGNGSGGGNGSNGTQPGMTVTYKGVLNMLENCVVTSSVLYHNMTSPFSGSDVCNAYNQQYVQNTTCVSTFVIGQYMENPIGCLVDAELQSNEHLKVYCCSAPRSTIT